MTRTLAQGEKYWGEGGNNKEFCGILRLVAGPRGWQGTGAIFVAFNAATQANLFLLRIPQRNSILYHQTL